MSTNKTDKDKLFNEEAELAVIAGVITTTKDEIREGVFGKLEVDDFFVSWNREVFKVCKDLWAKGSGIDYVTVSDLIPEPNRLNAALRMVSVNTLTHASIIKELSVRRNLANSGRELWTLATNRALPVEDVVDQASSVVFKATDNTGSKGLVSALTLSANLMSELQRRMTDPRPHVGIQSGYRSHEDLMGGFHTKKLDLLAARPAMGKTALMLNFAARTCVRKKVPTLIFSLEMSEEELTWRLMPIISRVSNDDIKTGQLDQQKLSALQYAVTEFSRSPLYIDDRSQRFSTMCASIRNAVRRYGVKQVFIDYLQLILPSGNSKDFNRDRELTLMAQGLKDLSKECDINIVALSQLNRGLEAREDKRPLLSDLRESGGLEQAADNVMMLYRPNVYDATEDEHEAQLLIRKHRNGALGTIPLWWDGERFLFEDMSAKVLGTSQVI